MHLTMGSISPARVPRLALLYLQTEQVLICMFSLSLPLGESKMSFYHHFPYGAHHRNSLLANNGPAFVKTGRRAATSREMLS